MAEGPKKGTPNGRDVYGDIIDHPHWQSPTRPHMSMMQRAAQFSPFDALEGYSDMLRELQRTTEEWVGPDEYEAEVLNQKLNMIDSAVSKGMHPTVTVTYFEPDKLKSGGKYTDITDAVKRVDKTARKIIFMSSEGYGGINKAVNISAIVRISGELVDGLDDAML